MSAIEVSPQTIMHLHPTDLNIRKFHGDKPQDIERFEEEVRALWTAQPTLTMKQKIGTILRNVSATIREELMCSPKEETEDPEEILKKLQLIYGDRRSVTQLVLALHQTTQGPLEGVRSFSARLHGIFRRLVARQKDEGVFVTDDKTIRDLFVDGLTDGHVRLLIKQHRRQYPNATYLDLRQLALDLEEPVASSAVITSAAHVSADVWPELTASQQPTGAPIHSSKLMDRIERLEAALQRLIRQIETEGPQQQRRRLRDNCCHECGRPRRFKTNSQFTKGRSHDMSKKTDNSQLSETVSVCSIGVGSKSQQPKSLLSECSRDLARHQRSEQHVEESRNNVVASRVTGKVKWFNVKAGYGFISRNDTKEDIFVHRTAIAAIDSRKGPRSLADGEAVDFNVVVRKKGKEAANVTGPHGQAVQGRQFVKVDQLIFPTHGRRLRCRKRYRWQQRKPNLIEYRSNKNCRHAPTFRAHLKLQCRKYPEEDLADGQRQIGLGSIRAGQGAPVGYSRFPSSSDPARAQKSELPSNKAPSGPEHDQSGDRVLLRANPLEGDTETSRVITSADVIKAPVVRRIQPATEPQKTTEHPQPVRRSSRIPKKIDRFIVCALKMLKT